MPKTHPLSLAFSLLAACSTTTLASSPLAAAEEAPSEVPAVFALKALGPAIASAMALAAEVECFKRGYTVSVAVVGRDGNLAAFVRSPLAGAHTILASQRKAYTSASTKAPTAALTERPDLRFAPGILIIPGGLPISAGGNFYGAIAVAGAEPKIDEACAQAGIEAGESELAFAQ